MIYWHKIEGLRFHIKKKNEKKKLIIMDHTCIKQKGPFDQSTKMQDQVLIALSIMDLKRMQHELQFNS